MAIVFSRTALCSGPIKLLSVPDASIPLTTGGNDDSVAPQISGDGRFVVFSSLANDLVTMDNGQLGLDVFLHDRASNVTVLVSANLNGDGGGNGSSMFGVASTNGRYVAFVSVASDLTPGDTNAASDVFVRDLQTGTTRLVSVANDGGSASGACTDAFMTPDGHYVAFISAATNLLSEPDTNGIPDVFVRDMVKGATRLASVGAKQPFGRPAVVIGTPLLTPDGRYVAFASGATGLSAHAPPDPWGEVYVRDLEMETTVWASTNAAEIALAVLNLSNTPSTHPALSDDGRFVAFKVGWTNSAATPPTGTVGAAVVLRYDMMTRLTTVVDTNGFPASPFSDDLFGPEMTPDGHFITFGAREVAGSNVCSSLRVWSIQTGTSVLASVSMDGSLETNTFSHTPALSPDGRFVIFLSDATHLTSNAVSRGFHIYHRDLRENVTRLVDADPLDTGSADSERAAPSLSDDGRFVAFSADATLAGADGSPTGDVFVRDVTGATAELVSRRNPAIACTSGHGVSGASDSACSTDGRWVVFTSLADDLVAGDTNGNHDVFVHDRLTGGTLLVSAGTDGLPARGGPSINPVISANGQFVAFVSRASNLVANGSSVFAQVFLRDIKAATNLLVSVGTNGLPGSGDSSLPVLSMDGRCVAFLSMARNLTPGGMIECPKTFWRDVVAGVTMLFGSAVSAEPSRWPPSMSLDGRFVAYSGSSSSYSPLSVRDVLGGTNIYTNLSAVTSAALSPSGTRLLYQVLGRIYCMDVLTRSNLFACDSKVLIQPVGQWSADGRFVVFVTAANALAEDNNGINDVYLCDLQTGALTLVSGNSALTGSANGPSDAPTVSSDGRFVAYRSFATDIVDGTVSAPNIFLFDRLAGSNSLITTKGYPSGWSVWVSKPVISGSGGTVAFQSWSSGLVAGDANRVQDVFAWALDSDNDGLPDWWTSLYFGHPTGQAADFSQAEDDADGDGMTNLREYLTGTDPTRQESVFQLVVAPSVNDPGAVRLSWPAVTGRSYRLEYKDSLTDTAWLDAAVSVLATGDQAGVTLPGDAAPQRFYRIVLND